jgi:hypothetical protein
MEDVPRLLLMYVVYPVWVAAGLADWACHRRTRIERTSGLKENLFHWLLMAEIGVAMLAVALLEVNAAILLLVFASYLAHELTTWIELQYTVPLREMTPTEQMIHSFLEMLPLLSLALLAVQHWGQVLSLLDESMPDFGLRWKDEPWPSGYLWAAFGAAALFNGLPLAEESWRCWRSRGSAARSPRPTGSA